MAELANCKYCGNVFVKSMRDICQACYKEEESAFQKVANFLRQRKNRTATLYEISDATGVEEEQIIKFLKEKRLTSSQAPMLSYPCERCGTDITEGIICLNCKNELTKDLQEYEKYEMEKSKEEQKNKAGESTYYSFNKHKKK